MTRSTIAMLAGLAALNVLTAVLFLSGSASGEAPGWSRLPIDDAWARLVYIRNFSDSFLFEFNSGELATGGTSPLWIALNGTLAAVMGLGSGDLPALSKVLGVLFAIISVWLVFRITWQLTRNRFAGLLAAAVLAVEPHFGFAAVSGMEVTLFAAVALAGAWVHLRGRTRTAGVFAAVAIAARPEGILLALLVAGSTVARWMWRREGAIFQNRRDVRDIGWLAVPSVAVILGWVAFNWFVAGSALPDSYLATSEPIGLLPLSNLWHVWLGYLHELPFMSGLAWVVGLPLVITGIYTTFKRHAFSAAPVALFALALVYAAMTTFTRPETAWLFDDRRHIDPAIPFIVIMLITGTVRAWRAVGGWKSVRKPQTERERRAVVITARVAYVALVIAPLAALPVRWSDLTSEYSWSSRGVEEVGVATGKWLAENTPEDAVIGAVPAGAIGYFADREVLDLSGKNTHDAQPGPAVQYGLDQNVDYLVAFRGPYFDSIPDRAAVNEEYASFGNPYFSGVLRIYGPPGSDIGSAVTREDLALFDSTGLQVIDRIDTGNGFAEHALSESAHDYGIDGSRSSTTVTAKIAPDGVLTDDARVFTVAEEFTVATIPNTHVTIVKRYDATVASRLRVLADGVEAGFWELEPGSGFFGENSFELSRAFVTRDRTRLRFEVIPGKPAIAGNSFFYWILVPEGSNP